MVRDLKARERDSEIVYLTARHDLDLERRVRPAGVMCYRAKCLPQRGRTLTLASFLRMRQADRDPRGLK